MKTIKFWSETVRQVVSLKINYVNLTGIRNVQQLVKTLFLDMSCGCPRRDQHLKWKSKCKRPSSPEHVGITQSTEHEQNRRRKRKGKFVLCLNWGDHLLLPSDSDTYWFLGLEVSYLPYTTGFLGSPTIDNSSGTFCYISISLTPTRFCSSLKNSD